MLKLGNHRIETVAIVDDDPRSRASLGMCVQGAPVSPFPIEGPLTEGLEAAYRLIAAAAQGCILINQTPGNGLRGFLGCRLGCLEQPAARPAVDSLHPIPW